MQHHRLHKIRWDKRGLICKLDWPIKTDVEIKSWLITVKRSEKENKISNRIHQNDAASLSPSTNAHIISGKITEILIWAEQVVLSLIHHVKAWLLPLCLKKKAGEMLKQDLK